MKTLEKLLGPETALETFFEKHFSKLPYSSAGGARDFCHLLNWTVVQNIFSEKKSVLRIVQDDRVIKDYVEIPFEEAERHHQQGHTLLLRFAERSDKNLKALADEFQAYFHTPVDIQLYCTPENNNAFGWHYDVEEVFIIQASGSKTYTIRPNTVHPLPLVTSIPKNLGYEQEKTPVQLQVTLKAGDWLYIPSGWWHQARTESESMHISLGLMPTSAVDLASHLPTYLAQFPFWRTRMPIHQQFPTEAQEIEYYRDAITKLGQDLVKHMSSDDFIKNFLNKKKN